MNILITGIDGFTGTHLATFLQDKGYNVYGTVIGEPTRENHLQCDIRNLAEVDLVVTTVKPDYIFHLAAISFVGESDKSLIYDVNVIGTQNILDALLKASLDPRKVIIASSATVYGNQNEQVLDESMCPKPVNHYGYSKLAMEHLVSTYFDRLNILMTRPFNYTGLGHSENFVIPKIVSHFVSGKKSIELGNLDVAREFNDIRIVVDIYWKLMMCDQKSNIVNLCTGNAVKLRDVISYLEELAGYKIEVKVNPDFVRKNEIPILTGSTKKIYGLIEVENEFTIEDTLKIMYKGIGSD